MIDEHAAAVLALLNSAITLPRKVYDGKVPDGIDVRVNPYVLVYFFSNDPEADFAAAPWRFELTAVCHCVGGNAQAARMISDLVRTALLGVVASVPGRACHPLTRTDSAPPQRDESTGSMVMDQIDSYLLASVPG